MEEIKGAVLQLLRSGQSTKEIKQTLVSVLDELNALELYMRAIKEADFRP